MYYDSYLSRVMELSKIYFVLLLIADGTTATCSQSGVGSDEVIPDISLRSTVRPANTDSLFVVSDAVTSAEVRQCLRNVN